ISVCRGSMAVSAPAERRDWSRLLFDRAAVRTARNDIGLHSSPWPVAPRGGGPPLASAILSRSMIARDFVNDFRFQFVAPDATGLPRGGSRFLLHKTAPNLISA